MSTNFFNFSSIIKQSGAAISSRLIPPNVQDIFLIVFIISLLSLLSTSYLLVYVGKSFKENLALPSITGLDAVAPRFP